MQSSSKIQLCLLCTFELAIQLTQLQDLSNSFLQSLKVTDIVMGISQLIIVILNQRKESVWYNYFIIAVTLGRAALQCILYPQEQWLLIFIGLHFQRLILTSAGFTNLLQHFNMIYLLVICIRQQNDVSLLPSISIGLLIPAYLGMILFFFSPRKNLLIKKFSSQGNSIQSEFKKPTIVNQDPAKELSIKKPRTSYQSKRSHDLSPKQYLDVNDSKREGGASNSMLLNSKNLQFQCQLVGTSALHETSQTEDEIILKQYNWIKGLSFIVFDHEENVICQTFMLSNYFNQSRSFNQTSEQEFLASFLSIPIVVGNRDLYEVLFQFDPTENHSYQSLVEKNDKDNTSYITYEDYPKYMLRTATPLIDLIRKVISDYDRFRKCYFIAYKMETTQSELQNTIVKFFVTQKKQKNYVFLQFDSPSQMTAAQSKQVFNQTKLINSLLTVFSSSMSSFLNCIITLSHIAQEDNSVDDVVYDKYFLPIQISSLNIYLRLANLRDYNLFLQNKLQLKLSTFRIAEIIEETISLLHETATARQVTISFEFEMQEQFQLLSSDLERFKQLLHSVVKHCLKYSSNGSVTISLTQQVTNFLQFQIKSLAGQIEDKELRQLNNNIRKYSFSSSLSIMELSQKGLTDEYPLIVANIIARKLAGTFKKGLEITKNTYTFYIESFGGTPSQNSQSECQTAIKFVGENKYYETSLSYIMAGGHVSDSSQQDMLQRDSTNKQYNEHSLQFSLSQISKQFSHKYSDHQSAYFSQFSKMSKFRQDSNISKKIGNSQMNHSNTLRNQSQNNLSVNNLSLKFLENQSYNSQSAYNLENKLKNPASPDANQQIVFKYIKNQDLEGQNNPQQMDSIKDMSKLSFSDQQVQAEIHQDRKAFFKSWRGSNQFIPDVIVDNNQNHNNSNNNNSKTQLDFDSDYKYNIQVPNGIQPKLMTTVFKYKIGSPCCSKVLIADPEFLNMQVLELILQNYTKKIERAFNYEEAMKKIDEKLAKPCQCGNKSFLLYFVNLELPVVEIFFDQITSQKGASSQAKALKSGCWKGSQIGAL